MDVWHFPILVLSVSNIGLDPSATILAILVLSVGGLGPQNFGDGFLGVALSVGVVHGLPQLAQLYDFGHGIDAASYYSLGMMEHQLYSLCTMLVQEQLRWARAFTLLPM